MLNIYNIQNLPNSFNDFPDIYFTKEYGMACEKSDNRIWELCNFKDLIYVYLKKSNFDDYNNNEYFDLITPYGYSGYYYKNEETYNEFIKLFNKKCEELNYKTQIIRQNPYINVKLSNKEIIKNKKIYGININNFNDYFLNVLNCSTRNMFTKAEKKKYLFTIEDLNNNNIEDFITMYHTTMKNLNADEYYYFNKNYFNCLINLKTNIKLCKIINNDNQTIGQVLILIYKNYIHYHLSCNNKSDNCINDYMILNIIKNYVNKIIILGGGLNDDDNLAKYKKKFSTIEFNYNIYKS